MNKSTPRHAAFGWVAAAGIALQAFAPASAATLTDITFKSNGGSYINDTIAEGSTSPLAFTAGSGLGASFLNAADSSVSLGYGNYYAIGFRGFAQHIGAGLVSFRVDGGPVVSQVVTFPDPASASSVFASFTLAGGDTVKIAATGLSADRIRVVADGGGLQSDGTPDAFYSFAYASAVPEPATVALLLGGLGALCLRVGRGRR